MAKISAKSSMQEALKAILLSDSVGTQDEIRLALEKLGYEVNQSKISRLLRKLGAIKTSNEHNEIIYTLPLEPVPSATKDILSQLIISIKTNESLIIIQTNPGSASLIGRLLDHNRDELNILGTVAGDDTIFIAPRSVKEIKDTVEVVKEFLVM